MNAYEFLTVAGVLSQKHRDDLKAKRGFSDDIINKHRLFSGGKYLLEFEQAMLKDYSQDELLASGIFTKPDRSDKIGMSTQILDDRVIIPYLNIEGKAYFVRPHKLGLEVPIQVYHEFVMATPSRSAILTEGEFKAIAGAQWGFPTIGIPGVSSFSDTHFKRFMEFVNRAKIKEICIIYDNEIKNDPSLPNYKEEINKRYDTEYFAYFMAKRLTTEGVDARIGMLPDSWRVNGKIDLDGALAAGHTFDDIRRVIAESRNHKAFFEDLPREAKNVVQRKIAQKFYRSHVSRDFGKYYATRYRGKHEFQEPISNFTIKILATHETPEEVVREVVLIDEYGSRSPSFSLPSSPMTSPDEFAKFCMAKGNFIWRGNRDDMAHIWQGEFFEDDGRHIVEPDHVGYIEDEKLYLFSNVAIKDDGTEMRPDKSNIFWMEKKGIKPVPLSGGERRNSDEGIPYLNISQIDMDDILTKLSDTVGRFEAMTALGWVSAVPFMNTVFELYNCFPFLFVTGRRGSGKSTIAEWCMHFFGIENAGKMASDTTAVAMQRYLSYFSGLPLFVDEYRNVKQVTMKNGFLRNAYNRQSAGKGIKSSFGVREAKIRGTVLLAGEETPDDNALLTRCVVISVLEKNRTVNHFNWFQSNKSKLSHHFYALLRRKPTILPAFVDCLNQGKDFFVKKGLDDRTAINYAVVGAGFMAAYGRIPDDFRNYLAVETSRVKQQAEQEQAVGVFMDDLLAYQSAGILRDRYWTVDADFIYLYFHGLYTLWAGEYRRVHANEPFKSSAIRDYLKEEPGFEMLDVVKRIGSHTRRCIVFRRAEAPDAIKALVEMHDSSVPDVGGGGS